MALGFIPVVGQIKQGLQIYNGREFFTGAEEHIHSNNP